MRLVTLVVAAVLALLTPLAHAQAPTADEQKAAISTCAGTLGVVRVSEIKPGKMDLFLKAVEAQAAWYQSHGLTEHVIYAARISERDAATGTIRDSETQAMSFHFNSLSGPQVPHDAAWNAFVKMFADSSSIKNEYHVCTVKKI